MAGQFVGEALGQRLFFGLERRERLLQFRDFGLEPFRLVLVALAHGRADELGGVIAAALRFLHARRDGAPFAVQGKDCDRLRLHPAPGKAGIEGCGVFADELYVVHGAALCRGPPPSASVADATGAIAELSRGKGRMVGATGIEPVTPPV